MKNIFAINNIMEMEMDMDMCSCCMCMTFCVPFPICSPFQE